MLDPMSLSAHNAKLSMLYLLVSVIDSGLAFITILMHSLVSISFPFTGMTALQPLHRYFSTTKLMTFQFHSFISIESD